MFYNESTRILSIITSLYTRPPPPIYERTSSKNKKENIPKSIFFFPLCLFFWLPTPPCVDYIVCTALLFTIHVYDHYDYHNKTALCLFLNEPPRLPFLFLFTLEATHFVPPNSVVRFFSPFHRNILFCFRGWGNIASSCWVCAACYQRHWQLAIPPPGQKKVICNTVYRLVYRLDACPHIYKTGACTASIHSNERKEKSNG